MIRKFVTYTQKRHWSHTAARLSNGPDNILKFIEENTKAKPTKSPSQDEQKNSTLERFRGILELRNKGNNKKSIRSPFQFSSTAPSASATSPSSRIALKSVSVERPDEYYMNCLCSRNNTHITLSNSQRRVVLTVSGGNVGFKKSKRATYEAAYEMCTRVFKHMTQSNITPSHLNLTFKDFGQGREAIFQCFLGVDGAPYRAKVRVVRDATKLKFGGVRAPTKRRV